MAEKIFIADKPTLDRVDTNVQELLNKADSNPQMLEFNDTVPVSSGVFIPKYEMFRAEGKGRVYFFSGDFGNFSSLYIDGVLFNFSAGSYVDVPFYNNVVLEFENSKGNTSGNIRIRLVYLLE